MFSTCQTTIFQHNSDTIRHKQKMPHLTPPSELPEDPETKFEGYITNLMCTKADLKERASRTQASRIRGDCLSAGAITTRVFLCCDFILVA